MFSPLELDPTCNFRGVTIDSTESLFLTGHCFANRQSVLGMRGVEVKEGSGEQGFVQVRIIQSDFNTFVGLATHDANHRRNFHYPLGWSRSGAIHGEVAGDVVGIMVDCTNVPTVRYFMNGKRVHQQEFTQEGHGQVFYPPSAWVTLRFSFLPIQTYQPCNYMNHYHN